MKTLYILSFCIFIATINLHAAAPKPDLVHAIRYYDSKTLTDDSNISEELYEVVETGSPNELKELLEAHRSTCERFLGNYIEKPTRTPPLHSAIVRGDKEIIRTLLDHNADINLADRTFMGNYNTPLHHAVQLKKPTRSAICQILIAQGAHVDIKNRLSKTPLYLACESFDDPHIPKLLIYHHVNIHTQNYQGLTPLHIAVAKGHFEVVKLLLTCGAKPWYVDYRNKTPMHIAIENRDRYPNNALYQNILAHLEAHNSFEAFVNDLLNFDEPASKRRKIDSSE
jgi:ankyrin repeat protein